MDMNRVLCSILAFALMLMSCSDDDSAVFNVSCKDTVEIGYEGKTLEVPFVASGDVTVSVSSSWVTFDLDHDPYVSSEGVLTLTVAGNGTDGSRETVVRISMAGADERNIRIRQETLANVLGELRLEAQANHLKEPVFFALDQETGMYAGKYLYWCRWS